MKLIFNQTLATVVGVFSIYLSSAQTVPPPSERLEVDLHNATLELKKSSSQEFRVTALNANFIAPTVRVNFFDLPDGNSEAKVSAFNLIGAGISLGGGRLFTTTDENFNIKAKKFKNTFAIQAGVMYSILNTSEQNTNVFATVFGISVLNFNVSVGREFGTLATGQKKVFTTISYNLPLSEIGVNSIYLLRGKKESEKVVFD